jgi:hypothetical protein
LTRGAIAKATGTRVPLPGCTFGTRTAIAETARTRTTITRKSFGTRRTIAKTGRPGALADEAVKPRGTLTLRAELGAGRTFATHVGPRLLTARLIGASALNGVRRTRTLLARRASWFCSAGCDRFRSRSCRGRCRNGRRGRPLRFGLRRLRLGGFGFGRLCFGGFGFDRCGLGDVCLHGFRAGRRRGSIHARGFGARLFGHLRTFCRHDRSGSRLLDLTALITLDGLALALLLRAARLQQSGLARALLIG